MQSIHHDLDTILLQSMIAGACTAWVSWGFRTSPDLRWCRPRHQLATRHASLEILTVTRPPLLPVLGRCQLS